MDIELERLSADAQRTADREGRAVAIYNLNSIGRRLLVIRAVSLKGKPAYAGPFEPRR